MKPWVLVVIGAGVLSFVIYSAYVLSRDPGRDLGKSFEVAKIAPTVHEVTQAAASERNQSAFYQNTRQAIVGGSGISTSSMFIPGTGGSGKGGRSYSASSIVDGNGSRSDAGSFPLGTVFSAKLSQNVLTAKNPSPVTAVITKEEVSEFGGAVVPEGTKLIGTATLDDEAERLQIQVSTLLYPDGTKYTVQGVALMPDGSYGLAGNYDGGNLSHDAGTVFGSLASGFAEGMKTRTTGPFGTVTETGSLRNGLLNGISDVARDHANQVTSGLSQRKSKISVPASTPFLLYFERDFSP